MLDFKTVRYCIEIGVFFCFIHGIKIDFELALIAPNSHARGTLSILIKLCRLHYTLAIQIALVANER